MSLHPRITAILSVLLLLPVANFADDSATEKVESADKLSIRIVSFSIIDTRTQKVIEGFDKISKDSKIAISELPTARINVRANVSGRPGSVRFIVPEKKINRVESKPPYSLAGDVYGRFLKWNATPGSYTLTAIPYASRSGRGAKGESLNVKVRFTE